MKERFTVYDGTAVKDKVTKHPGIGSKSKFEFSLNLCDFRPYTLYREPYAVLLCIRRKPFENLKVEREERSLSRQRRENNTRR